eukprot:TRINITY_DN11340_c0_g1_i1.p1 TRINITY_DN11340_c0_g1~~TRINITY_DN11340_c0_g1_i1.p1  ORF type:complete len:149 (+),score=20.61 TRINITY_DN11340_c0_g1_i1:90-536(+)
MNDLIVSGTCCATTERRCLKRSKSLAVGVQDLLVLKKATLSRSNTIGAVEVPQRRSSLTASTSDNSGSKKALKRIKSFHNSIRVAREAKESSERAAQKLLLESRERDIRSRQVRRNEIYALNTMLSHIDLKKQSLFANGVIDSVNGGV